MRVYFWVAWVQNCARNPYASYTKQQFKPGYCLLWNLCEIAKKVCSESKRVRVGISGFSRRAEQAGYIQVANYLADFGFACHYRDKLGCKSGLPILYLMIMQLKRKTCVF